MTAHATGGKGTEGGEKEKKKEKKKEKRRAEKKKKKKKLRARQSDDKAMRSVWNRLAGNAALL